MEVRGGGVFISLVPLEVPSDWPLLKVSALRTVAFLSMHFPSLHLNNCFFISSLQDEGRSESVVVTSPGCICGSHLSLPLPLLKKKKRQNQTKPFIEPSSDNPNLSVSSISSGTLTLIVSLLKQQSKIQV